MKLLDTLNRILKPHKIHIQKSRVNTLENSTEYTYILIKYKRVL